MTNNFELNDNEKLDLIQTMLDYEILDEENLQVLETLSHDRSDEIRSEVANILVNSKSLIAEKILIRLLNDKDELVRANACDSLCYSNSYYVIEHLQERIKKDTNGLVRGYAALSIGDIASRENFDIQETVLFLKQELNKPVIGR